MPTDHHRHQSGTTVRYVLRSPPHSSYNLVDLGSSSAKPWCSSSKGPPPHLLSIVFLVIISSCHEILHSGYFWAYSEPTNYSSWIWQIWQCQHGQEWIRFLGLISFSIQKEGSIDSADLSHMLTPNCRRLNHLRHQLLHGRKLWIIDFLWSCGGINFGVLSYVSVLNDRL